MSPSVCVRPISGERQIDFPLRERLIANNWVRITPPNGRVFLLHFTFDKPSFRYSFSFMGTISQQRAIQPIAKLAPIVYAKQIMGGIMVRPDSRAVMRKAIEGHPVEVGSGNDYINLYHVFERMVSGDKKLSKLRLIRKQVGQSRWLIFVVGENEAAPDVPLLDGYDPKRGRYKRYAEQLAAGDAVQLPTKAEAIKARRAWQLYVPAGERRNLRSTIRKVPKTGKFLVLVLEREKQK